MFLAFPEHFTRDTRDYKVQVRDGILYIAKTLNFERLMYDLTFWKYGDDECFYCHRKFVETKMTIDHVYPRKYGGVSVPENLRPACHKCNSQKGSMNPKEFEKFRRIKTRKTQEKYKQKCSKRKEKILYRKGFELPDEWIKMVSCSDIIFPTYCKFTLGEKYKKNMEFIKKYGHVPKPIVISSNNVILDGRIVKKSAERMGLEQIPAIILENVIASIDGN